MFRRVSECLLLLLLIVSVPQQVLGQPLQISAQSKVASARKDIGDGLCATVAHVQDPALGQVPFSTIDDALGTLNRTSPRLTEDARTSALFSLVNFKNNDPVAMGDFPGDVLFPYSDNPGAAPPGNDRNFAVRLRGYINVDASDAAGLQRTLGVMADDGVRLQVGSAVVTVPDVDQRISSRRIRQVQYGSAGLYPIEIIYYQDGSNAVLELSESNQWVPENTKLTNLRDLGFTLVGAPRPNLFVNTELYSARAGAVAACVECSSDATCGSGNYCVKDWGPTPPNGLCQACVVADHCGADCRACTGTANICHEGGCIQCLVDSDCTAGGLCNAATHSCIMPMQDWSYVGGCSATATAHTSSLPSLFGALAAGLLTLLLLRRRRLVRRLAGPLALLGILLCAPGTARAQLSANTETFRPAIGPENIITIEGSRTGMALRPMLVGLIEYSHRPLRLIDNRTQQTLAETIRNITTLHLMAGLGITRWLSVAVDLPVVLYENFDRATPIQDVPVTPSSYGLGDVRVVAKVRLINNQKQGFGLAFVPQVSFPSGDGTQFRGDDSYDIEPRVALDYRSLGGAIVALNLGFLGRTSDQTVRNMRVGSQIRYGVGMYVPLPEGFGLMGEFAGGTSISSAPSGVLYSPMEGHVGGRWVHASGFNLNLGTGLGFTEAVGSPKFRFFASIGYLPVERKKVHVAPDTAQILVEKAGSGAGLVTAIPGGIDCGQACSADYKLGTQVTLRALPTGGHRFVGWSGPCSGTEDCVLTVHGPTRISAEFAHPEERRATVSIDKEGDGLGEVLSDPSGVWCGKVCSASYRIDQEVRFVAVPGKESRFAGWEGACTGVEPCTMVVRGDSTLKARFIKSQITVTPQKLDLQGNVVHFETAKASVDIDSFHLLDEVTVILRQSSTMRLRVEGHTDAVPFNAPGGNLQLSKDRAAAVVQYLVDHGITGARLSSEGYGDRCPVSTNQTAEGRQANRRTEFLIVDPTTGQFQRTPCVDYTPAPRGVHGRKIAPLPKQTRTQSPVKAAPPPAAKTQQKQRAPMPQPAATPTQTPAK